MWPETAASPPVHEPVDRRVPGDLLLHPVAVLAVILVILNDRVLKVQYPGQLSGKLSDFAGLVYFPLFLVSCIEAARWLFRRRHWELTSRAVLVAALVVGVAFVAIKTWHPAGEVYRTVMGLVLYPLGVPAGLWRDEGLPALSRVSLIEDRVDLLALPALVLPVWVARRVMGDPVGTRAG